MSMPIVTIRPYCEADYGACMDIFDTNCPEYLDPGERQDYREFLDDLPGRYEVCEVDGQVVGAFGLSGDSKNEKRLDWILIHSKAQGMGIGAKIMERVIHLGRKTEATIIGIATSQKVAPFFEKYGARTTLFTKDGFGSGIDRVDMVLSI